MAARLHLWSNSSLVKIKQDKRTQVLPQAIELIIFTAIDSMDQALLEIRRELETQIYNHLS